MKTGRADLDHRLKISSVPVDAPTFFIREHDDVIAQTIRAYVGFQAALGAPPAVLEQALQQADRAEAWPVKKRLDADHLTEAAAKQLEYELGRRVWRWASSLELPTETDFLANRVGFEEAAGRARHAASLIDAGMDLLFKPEPNLEAAMILIDKARAALRDIR